MTKNLGAGVSGWRDPEGRNWETTVYQASKPVIDAELNLTQDTEQDTEARFRRRSLPSGWIAGDFLDNSDSTIGIFNGSVVANELETPQDLRAHVNGWLLRVGHTNANGASVNLLDLGAGPAGAGAKRTDLVILEVWRVLLSASPSTTAKSQTTRIWWHGNVKIHTNDDVALNFADDILDAGVGSETTKRVQIQYRLRVLQGVDVFGYPYGIDDPTVVARSVPPNAATPDGNATVFTYASQSSVGDPGLWRAGDGNPANTIGSVDGYMYAIPLMAVIRRNTTAFDRNSNHNGDSGRPDGLTDLIDTRDIIDLRFGINPSGWDFNELLQKNFNWLLDNVLRTEVYTTLIGGGVQGNSFLWADEFGITNAHGGDGTTTGDTPGAEFIGEFDSGRRRFSDRSIVETVPVRYVPADGSGGGPNWANNDIITISPTNLPIYPYAAYNWSSYNAATITILGITEAYYLGQAIGKERVFLGGDAIVTGLGTIPQDNISLDIGTVGSATDENLVLWLLVSYPKGLGLTRTPTDDFGSSSVSINNPGQMPAGAPIYYASIEDDTIDWPHRELFLTYETVDLSIRLSGPQVGGLDDVLIFPERVLSISALTINGGAYGGSITISADGYRVTLDALSFSNGDYADITYKAVRPFPQNDEQVTVYYEARAPMTIRDAHLGTSLTLIPRAIARSLTSFTIGSGSQDEAFPFPFQYVQQPGVYPTSGGSFGGDHEFDAGGRIQLESYGADTGYIELPVFTGYVPNPQEAIFDRLGGDIDAEGRSFFKSVPGGAYVPSAFAQPYRAAKQHRVLLPMIAELAADSTLGRKGQLVLAVFGAIWPTSDTNSIAWDTNLANNYTSLSVYRLKGNLLNRRSA